MRYYQKNQNHWKPYLARSSSDMGVDNKLFGFIHSQTNSITYLHCHTELYWKMSSYFYWNIREQLFTL